MNVHRYKCFCQCGLSLSASPLYLVEAATIIIVMATITSITLNDQHRILSGSMANCRPHTLTLKSLSCQQNVIDI